MLSPSILFSQSLMSFLKDVLRTPRTRRTLDKFVVCSDNGSETLGSCRNQLSVGIRKSDWSAYLAVSHIFICNHDSL